MVKKFEATRNKLKGSAHVVCGRKSLLAAQPSAQITPDFVPCSEMQVDAKPAIGRGCFAPERCGQPKFPNRRFVRLAKLGRRAPRSR
jgi:hypothetical protein